MQNNKINQGAIAPFFIQADGMTDCCAVDHTIFYFVWQTVIAVNRVIDLNVVTTGIDR